MYERPYLKEEQDAAKGFKKVLYAQIEEDGQERKCGFFKAKDV